MKKIGLSMKNLKEMNVPLLDFIRTPAKYAYCFLFSSCMTLMLFNIIEDQASNVGDVGVISFMQASLDELEGLTIKRVEEGEFCKQSK